MPGGGTSEVRGKLVAAALGTVAVLLAAGCAGRPAGVDGNLTNNWPAMPEPKLPVPADQACYDVSNAGPAVTKLPPPVDCAAMHNLQTIHVGTFGGDDAARDAPPPGSSPAQQNAYTDCTKVARDVLGDDWRGGRLGLDLVLPTSTQWDAGGRWYRCDLLEFVDLNDYAVARRQGSLQGALAGSRPLGLGCFKLDAKDADDDTMAAVDCASGHNSEFAGVWEAPAGPYPADPSQRNKLLLDGCRSVVAAFAGVPNDDKFKYRTGQVTFGFGKSAWDLGNRAARCYLWMNDKTITRSLKGAGTGGLPINYA